MKDDSTAKPNIYLDDELGVDHAPQVVPAPSIPPDKQPDTPGKEAPA